MGGANNDGSGDVGLDECLDGGAVREVARSEGSSERRGGGRDA